MMLLNTFTLLALSPRRPPVARLTGPQAQLILQRFDDLLDLVANFVGLPDLVACQAQPVRRIVFAAVSHHNDSESPGQRADGMPVRVPAKGFQRLAREGPILLQLAHEIPAIIPDALEQRLRGIPRIEQDKAGLELEPVAGITQQLQRQVKFGRAAFPPDP